jgi:hypothetical protein
MTMKTAVASACFACLTGMRVFVSAMGALLSNDLSAVNWMYIEVVNTVIRKQAFQ